MPLYISLMKLTDQGSKDIMNAPARVADAVKLYEKMGGKVIGLYVVMGEYDYIGIGEGPSDEMQAAFSLAICSQGNVKTTTFKAFPANEMPAILKKLPKP